VGFADVIIIPSIFVGIPWILVLAFKASQSHQRFMKVLQLKADMNSRLLDRAATDPAALELLKSEAHQQIFNVSIDEPPAPYVRVLTAMQMAFMLVSGGAACLWFAPKVAPHDGQKVFTFLGGLGVALGIGALMSAVAALVAVRLWRSLKTPA